MTKEQEDQIINHWRQGRRFNVKNFKDWMDLIIKTAAVGALSIAVTAFFVNAVAPEWANVPKDINSLATEVAALREVISFNEPQIVEFKGNLIVADNKLRAGDNLQVTAVLRRNAGCATQVINQFYDHNANLLVSRYTYVTDAVKTPVSEDFGVYTFQVVLPSDMSLGRYSYSAKLVPLECGVYEEIVLPLSTPFYIED